MDNEPQKRRRQPRAHLDVYINKIIGDEPHLARVRDISPTGVYLYRLLEPEIAADQTVGLELMLPNSPEIIWAVAKPARREQDDERDGVAYDFVRISAEDRQLIRDYVEIFADEQAYASRAA